MSKDEKPEKPFSGVAIVGGSFNNNGKGGIRVGSGDVRIIGAETNDNGGDGVSLGENANAHIEDHRAEGNEGLGVSVDETPKTNRIRPLLLAIKKPLANSKKGLKIIVGFLFISIVGPLTVNIFTELWKERRVTTNQAQPQASQQTTSADIAKK
jgi:hypothetical protein